MASASASAAMAAIPRFLLPRRGPLWQRASATSLSPRSPRRPAGCTQARHASSARPKAKATKPDAPAGRVLEKPAKFNPPSHGSRLPRKGLRPSAPASQHYGGDLSAADREAQRLRQYPGLMAPPGTWAHWIWSSRAFHLTVTMGALTALAVYTFFENFKRTSPYVDLLPSAADFAAHPIDALSATLEVVQLTEHHRIAEIAERRQQRVDDVAKRTMYRKAHGLPETVGIGTWLGITGDQNQGPTPPARNEDTAAPAVDDASPIRGAAPAAPPSTTDDGGKRKKFLGIF